MSTGDITLRVTKNFHATIGLLTERVFETLGGDGTVSQRSGQLYITFTCPAESRVETIKQTMIRLRHAGVVTELTD